MGWTQYPGAHFGGVILTHVDDTLQQYGLSFSTFESSTSMMKGNKLWQGVLIRWLKLFKVAESFSHPGRNCGHPQRNNNNWDCNSLKECPTKVKARFLKINFFIFKIQFNILCSYLGTFTMLKKVFTEVSICFC